MRVRVIGHSPNGHWPAGRTRFGRCGAPATREQGGQGGDVVAEWRGRAVSGARSGAAAAGLHGGGRATARGGHGAAMAGAHGARARGGSLAVDAVGCGKGAVQVAAARACAGAGMRARGTASAATRGMAAR
nr:glycine-rich protein 1-like [Aegilops tauschii subsp. strangulata]